MFCEVSDIRSNPGSFFAVKKKEIGLWQGKNKLKNSKLKKSTGAQNSVKHWFIKSKCIMLYAKRLGIDIKQK